jgi:hypothetical protein
MARTTAQRSSSGPAIVSQQLARKPPRENRSQSTHDRTKPHIRAKAMHLGSRGTRGSQIRCQDRTFSCPGGCGGGGERETTPERRMHKCRVTGQTRVPQSTTIRKKKMGVRDRNQTCAVWCAGACGAEGVCGDGMPRMRCSQEREK